MTHMLRSPLQRFTRALGRLASLPLALLILFEEWGWEPLQRALARLGERLGLKGIEARISRLPPVAALVTFLVPSLMLLPVKLAALWLISRHHMLLGTAVIVMAKIAGTAVVARLFTLTKPALLQLEWFAKVYDRWSRFKAMLVMEVRASWPWRVGRITKRRWRRRWRLWMRRRKFAG